MTIKSIFDNDGNFDVLHFKICNNVHFIASDTGAIVLHLRHNLFIECDEQSARVLSLLSTQNNVDYAKLSNQNVDGIDLPNVVAGLIQSGLIEKRQHISQTFIRRSYGVCRLIPTWFFVLYFKFCIFVGRIDLIANAVANTKAIDTSPTEIKSCRLALWLLEALSFRDACLLHASVVAIWRRRCGINCNLIVGVSERPFVSHAWLEEKGVSYGADNSVLNKMKIILRV